MAKTQPIEKYVAGVRLVGGLLTNKPVIFNAGLTLNGLFNVIGVSAGTLQTLTPAATITLLPTSTVITDTVGQAQTINFATPPVSGTEIWIEFISNGTAFAVTFGTNSRNQGILTTGAVAGLRQTINFVSDGTFWVEVGRVTVSM